MRGGGGEAVQGGGEGDVRGAGGGGVQAGLQLCLSATQMMEVMVICMETNI